MHLPNLILDLALILSVAAITSILFRWLKQPVVLGYILAGLVVGPQFTLFPTVIDEEGIRIWAEIGVIILLFNLGLEFSFRKLLKEGLRVVVIALSGVLLTLLMGYGLGMLMGWSRMDSIFFGGILSIASTTIIIKAFGELGVKSRKFTNIVTNVLIVEDIVAVVLMVILSTISISREFEGWSLMMSVGKLLFFLVLWFISGIFFLPVFLRIIRKLLNEEVLLIVSLALCFAMVILALKAGFSPAFGAFVMGSLLAETTRTDKIEHLIAPLRNLFGAIFFVSVGMLLDVHMLLEYYVPVICAVLVLLIGKPLFVIGGSLITGQPLKIAVQSGMSLSQIGEFSFIIATLGLSLHVTSDFLYPVAVAVSVVTTFTTPYMIRFSEPVVAWAGRVLPRRFLRVLETYSISAQKVSEVSDWKKLLRSNFYSIVITSVIIVTIILFGVKVIQPFFNEYSWSKPIAAAFILLLLAPFLWALASWKVNQQAYARVWTNPDYRAPLILLQILKMVLAVFYLGFLFDSLFSPWIALVCVVVASVVLILLSGQLQKSYRRIEERFIIHLNQKEEQGNGMNRNLGPWDTHLTSFRLSSTSPFVGKSLVELQLREQYGVNIAAIERDDRVINVPGRGERLFPNDIVSVIGTDEQLARFQEEVEKPETGAGIVGTRNDVKLLHFKIQADSDLVGKSIKASAIRERTKGLVVGIERSGERILNPESDFVFREADIVWVVGNEKRVQIVSGLKS